LLRLARRILAGCRRFLREISMRTIALRYVTATAALACSLAVSGTAATAIEGKVDEYPDAQDGAWCRSQASQQGRRVS
jgi:hypothetical protein